MRDAVIVDAVRSPIGRRNGALSEVHPVNLSAHVLSALAERTGVDPASVDDVQWGCVSQVGAQAGIVSRSAVFAAGWPETVPATTINRACGSSQQAVSFAAGSVIADQADVVVAGGVESMSLVPMGSAVKNPGENYPPEVLERFGVSGFSQGIGAEMIAEKWGFSRTQLDEFSLRSHELSAAATDAGAFEKQIAPIAGLSTDEASAAAAARVARQAQDRVQGGWRDPRRQLLADLRRCWCSPDYHQRVRGGAGMDPPRAYPHRGRGRR